MSDVTMIDLSGVYALEDLIKATQNKGIEVVVSDANNNIKRILKRLNFMNYLNKDFYNDSKNSIIDMIIKKYNLKT